MRFLPGIVDEKLRVEALAHEPPLHIDLADQHRIYRARFHFLS